MMMLFDENINLCDNISIFQNMTNNLLYI